VLQTCKLVVQQQNRKGKYLGRNFLNTLGV
jgi:hypothetical protein